MDEDGLQEQLGGIDVPLFKKVPRNPKRPESGICPACHTTVVRRHCIDPPSPTCTWFVCVHHAAVDIIFGARGHYSIRKFKPKEKE